MNLGRHGWAYLGERYFLAVGGTAFGQPAVDLLNGKKRAGGPWPIEIAMLAANV
jgi:hypothetical protein